MNTLKSQVGDSSVLSSFYVWWTSWNISSRGIFVSGPYSLHALLSKAATICFTTSSKNNVASWECRSERNSKETCRKMFTINSGRSFSRNLYLGHCVHTGQWALWPRVEGRAGWAYLDEILNTSRKRESYLLQKAQLWAKQT